MRTLPIEEERMLTQYFSELTPAQREAARNALRALPDSKEVSLASFLSSWNRSVLFIVFFWGSVWLLSGWQSMHVVFFIALGLIYPMPMVILAALQYRNPLHVFALHAWKDGPSGVGLISLVVPLLFLVLTGHTVAPFLVIFVWATTKHLHKKIGMRTSTALREIEERVVQEQNKNQ